MLIRRGKFLTMGLWGSALTLVGAMATSTTVLAKPDRAPLLTSPKTFADWCTVHQTPPLKQRQEIPWEIKSTVALVLATLGTQDCTQAQTKLHQVTDLRITDFTPYPATTPIPPSSYLRLDAPAGLDLGLLFRALPNVRRLDLHKIYIPDFTPLKALTQLEELDISDTGLHDLKSLATLSTLVRLDISRNEIKDLTPLAGLKALRHLDVRYNQVRDFRVLDQWPQLHRLGLSHNPIDPATCPGRWGDACDPHDNH
jgi:Leucine rich repeat